MNKPARNSLKGYTYQTYILTLFLALMDTKRDIHEIECESITAHQFDDIFVTMENSNSHRIQVKNYPGTTIEDITVTNTIVTIRGNKNRYNSKDSNIIVVNTDRIPTDTEFMGIPATAKDNIMIIPITQEQVADTLDALFQRDDRELQIILKAYEMTCSATFKITKNDLPALITLSTDLADNTVLVRQVPKQFNRGINYIIGKPGVGKSHYVEELTKIYSDAIVYRFWVSAHDENLSYRLRYDTFLTDIGLKTFRTPRSFSENELLEKLCQDNRMLIIDGLDHVENYNPQELLKYFSFLKLLEESNIMTVVLSRPLKNSLPWEFTELLNWDFNETSLYLVAAHNICAYDIHKIIYEYTGGYPIITRFLAEHFKKYGELNSQKPIDDINTYYNELLKDVATKSSLCVFATNNSFFTFDEIKAIFTDPEAYDVLIEFIDAFPYLFERIQNRIYLVHDSLNTYLRDVLAAYPKRNEIVIDMVQTSLTKYEVEYMDRLSSFIFDGDFLNRLLIQYSDFEALEKLFSTTLDFDSIASFYKQLQYVLEKNKGVLDIYQYYSFALIYQIITRNDLFGYEGLVYQILLYMQKHSNIENSIFSSGFIWNVYLFGVNRGDLTEKFVSDSMYGNIQYDSIGENIESEVYFFDRFKPSKLPKSIIDELKSAATGDISDMLKEYLISVWLHGTDDKELRREFNIYYETGETFPMVSKLRDVNIETYYIQWVMRDARYRLQELGVGGEDNIFRSSDLFQLIVKYAPQGSFEATTVAQSYIRLANHENRVIDIYSINYIWAMYAQRKDYSVHTLDSALILFEEQGFLGELDSVEILNRLINQSEKGIRRLLSSYINEKGVECTKRLVKSGTLFQSGFNADIVDLSPENINCLSKGHVFSRMMSVLEYHRYSRTLEVSDIENLLMSKHCDYVLQMLRANGYSFISSADKELVDKVKSFGIPITYTPESQIKEYVPFENGYIHEADLQYIQEKNIPIEKCIMFADGWYTCMPFLSIFEYCDPVLLKEKHLGFLHDAMFARVVDQRYVGHWYNLIGYIPKYLRMCDIDVEWNKMFKILMRFFDFSMIYYPS